jgi:lysyl-tRNA synthetase class 2
MSAQMTDWRPTASLEALRLRAGLLGTVRTYFREQGVLEVETPALATAAVTDVHLASLEVRVMGAAEAASASANTSVGHVAAPRYLHTSPEYHMKRLLAAGSGDIWQAARVFRGEELSQRHNVEFTLLEWYRVGFTLEALVVDIDTLLRRCLAAPRAAQGLPLGPARTLTHREAFLEHTDVDSQTATLEQLHAAAAHHLGTLPAGLQDRDTVLDLLLGMVVAPCLGRGEITYLVDWPASQAALAKLRPASDGIPVAARVEAYLDGLELCNGFEELTDANEQRERFAHDAARREAAGLPVPAIDEHFLAALEHGLPPCSGVAVGFDRIAMLAAGTRDIRDVLAFPYDRA